MSNWKLLLPVILFLLFSQTISAQISCLPNSAYQDSSYWQADLVFVGLVEKISVEDIETEQNSLITTDTYKNLKNYYIRFTVEQSYRGDVDKTIELKSNFSFKEGEKYFVYAVRGKDEKIYKLNDGICGKPPILLTDAQEDVEYAEEIASGKLGTRIYGFVYQDKQDSFKTLRQSIPLAEIEVTIKNPQNTFKTKTDVDGKYVFKNIPFGEYKISAAIPEGMRQREIQNIWRLARPYSLFIGKVISPISSDSSEKTLFRYSDSYNFGFTSLSSIAGKVVDKDGEIPPQQFLWLLPIDENGKSFSDSPAQYLWIDKTNGKFMFNAIPKGKYLIAINRLNCHTDRNPEYRRTFFPGVSDEVDSEIVTVGENQNIQLKDFRLPQPLKERRFSGVVLSVDKTPLKNATVFIINSNSKSPNKCFSEVSEVKTDRFGRFTIKGYESYEYRIRAIHSTN